MDQVGCMMIITRSSHKFEYIPLLYDDACCNVYWLYLAAYSVGVCCCWCVASESWWNRTSVSGSYWYCDRPSCCSKPWAVTYWSSSRFHEAYFSSVKTKIKFTISNQNNNIKVYSQHVGECEVRWHRQLSTQIQNQEPHKSYVNDIGQKTFDQLTHRFKSFFMGNSLST